MAATIASIGAGTYANETLTIGPATPPSAVFRAGIEIECSAWTDPTSSAVVTFEYSTDGEIWTPWFSGTFWGGTLTKQGGPLASAIMSSGLPPAPSVGIQAKIEITGSLVTQGISLMTGI